MSKAEFRNDHRVCRQRLLLSFLYLLIQSISKDHVRSRPDTLPASRYHPSSSPQLSLTFRLLPASRPSLPSLPLPRPPSPTEVRPELSPNLFRERRRELTSPFPPPVEMATPSSTRELINEAVPNAPFYQPLTEPSPGTALSAEDWSQNKVRFPFSLPFTCRELTLS